MLQQEAGVEMSREAEHRPASRLSIASLLFFFHYPRNSLKGAGFSKKHSISDSLLFNIVITHQVPKESEYKTVLKVPACSLR